ncbi:MAG TPA: DUF2225 domain-containing protein [Methanocella sp.]|uniref:DUF2225 domain-containing protein n=1 Tax=Methanocella sp. TaxID=2052833 RepID=UPI002BDA51CF|nr:DUF2225 domain-containing protein [Methanocella sp.]HTY90490.1 DUF2225 domain-containing protein [Methanocella sp.]
MTTLQPHQFTCPFCGNKFESQMVASTNSFGRLHSDLYKEAEGLQPVCYFVHTCASCGYTGYEGDFQPQSFTPVFKGMLEENITPEIKKVRIGTNGNYYLAALCAEWRGAPFAVLARIYHMGAWCCRIKGEKDNERFYLEKAMFYFERALEQADAPNENKAVYTYLIGDIARRLGDAEKAKSYYGKVEQALKECGGEPGIGDFARRQLTSPSDYF